MHDGIKIFYQLSLHLQSKGNNIIACSYFVRCQVQYYLGPDGMSDSKQRSSTRSALLSDWTTELSFCCDLHLPFFANS